MNQFFKLVNYYLLLLLGLIMTSWILWARFLRERTIRNIPDGLFTEYRFWILLYISFIYFYVVKNYIKPKASNIFLFKLSELLYIPLMTLDNSIKYNQFIEPYYDKFINKLTNSLYFYDRKEIEQMLYIFEIIPRCILIFFLLLDTFYFHKLEIFYKVVLVGLYPFIWRYISYSLKDVVNHWILKLEAKYEFVLVYEKGRKFQLSLQWKKPEYHSEKVSIKEYIELQIENKFEHEIDENFPHKYIGVVFAKDEIYKNYRLEKYNDMTRKLTLGDYNNIRELFEDLSEKIITLKIFLDDLAFIRDSNLIKLPKIIIFAFYGICWSFTLVVCYWCYPVEFLMFKYFSNNLAEYLILLGDQFTLQEEYSFNKNLVTIENVKILLQNISIKTLSWLK